MTNHQGQQFDNYRIIHQLGAGSFGTVYLAEHVYRTSQAPVAIKVLSQLPQDDLRCFLAEARAAHLQHPNIVRVLDFGVEGNIPFIVMEYAPNGTLRQRHPKGTQVPLSTIIFYVQQIASALQYAHDERLVHRDIKPENLLIGEQNQILLSDFGLATIARSMSPQSVDQLVGTIPYMAPEQIQRHPHPASDQYSLGVVVYEWLCGERPFKGSFTEIAAKHTMVPPPPLHEKMPIIAPEVEQIVMTALAKDPKQRFDSVSTFASTLEQAYANTSRDVTQPIQPKPVAFPAPSPPEWESTTSAIERTRKPNPHRISRRKIALGLGVGLIAAAVTSGFTWLEISHQPSSGTHPTPTLKPKPTPKPTPTSIPPGSLLYTYPKHLGRVNAVVWSLDGKRIASGSNDKTVQVWDAVDGGNVYIYPGHIDIVEAVAWSRDDLIASGSWDKTVQVWNAANGHTITTYTGHKDPVYAVAWSPDGKRIASGGYDQTVQVWDASNGSPIFTYSKHIDAVHTVAWSPDGKRIASGSYDQTVQVWDATDGGNPVTYSGHSGSVLAVTWSPDGKRIASCAGDADTKVQVWDSGNGSHIFTYTGHSAFVNTVAWSHDGKQIASGAGGNDHTVQVWNAANGDHIFTYTGHSLEVMTVAWSPDDRHIASGGDDKIVQVWQAR